MTIWIERVKWAFKFRGFRSLFHKEILYNARSSESSEVYFRLFLSWWVRDVYILKYPRSNNGKKCQRVPKFIPTLGIFSCNKRKRFPSLSMDPKFERFAKRDGQTDGQPDRHRLIGMRWTHPKNLSSKYWNFEAIVLAKPSVNQSFQCHFCLWD